MFGSTTTVRFTATRGRVDLHRRHHPHRALGHAERHRARRGRGQRRRAHPARRPRRATTCSTVVADFEYTNTGEGLHRFVDPVDGEVYLYSQFEVPDSRRVFAVFEQPDLKATFQFTVTAPAALAGRQQLSHARARRRRRRPRTWAFAPTPVLSSYITALIAGPYEVVRSRAHQLATAASIPLGIFARKSLTRVPRRRLHLREDPPGLRVLRGEVRLPLPVRQVRPALRARVQRRRDGERGRGHLHRDLRVPLEGHRRDQGAPGRHDPARARPHVVRRPRHHEVVERPVAERVVRRVGVDHRDRRGHRVDRGVDHVPGDGEELGVPPGPAALDPPGRRDDQRPRRRAGQLRRHHLRQGRLGAQAARRLGRHRRVLRRRRRVLPEARTTATPSSSDLLAELEATSGRDLTSWSKLWLETAGVNTLRPEIETDDAGVITSFAVLQEAAGRLPDDPPAPPRDRLLRPAAATRSCAPTASSSTSTATRTEVPELVGLNAARPRAAQRRRPRLRQDPPRRASRSPPPSRTSPTSRPARPRARLGLGLGRDPRRRDRAARLRATRARQHRHRDRVDDDPHHAHAAAAGRPQLRRPGSARRRSPRSATRSGRSRRRPRPAPTRSSSS